MKDEPAARKEVLEDLKEQLLFLKEIGVDGLQAELHGRTETEEPEIAHSDFQTYVPRKSERLPHLEKETSSAR